MSDLQNERVYRTLYESYADVLVLSGVFTDETISVLENVLETASSPSTASAAPAHARLLARIHLSNVLLRLGKRPEAQQECVPLIV